MVDLVVALPILTLSERLEVIVPVAFLEVVAGVGLSYIGV
jgi:hypothetical protein